MTNLEQLTRQYDYPLSRERIALSPAEPREMAKLLVYDRGLDNIRHDHFINLGRHLTPKSLLVFNETKVLPARLSVIDGRGREIQLLFVEWRDGLIKMLSPKKLLPDNQLRCGPIDLRVVKKIGPHYFLKPLWRESAYKKNKRHKLNADEFREILLRRGRVPLPPYLKRTSLTPKQIKEKYQTVFAKKFGAIAAPTASLHFSNKLLLKLKKDGHQLVFVTLHVGLGTFARLTQDNLDKNCLHQEFFEIKHAAAKLINRAKKSGQKIVAVGTTVTRAIESAGSSGVVAAGTGETKLFIKPGYDFKIIDHLVTNFHVPSSSLMMLVAALTGREKLLRLYRTAAREKYRFFSFGDGMLVR